MTHPGRGWRRTLFALHGTLGLFVGALLAFVAFTGSLTVFRREIDWLTTPALRVAPPTRAVSFDAVGEAASRAHPCAPGESLWWIQRPEGERFAWSVLFRAGERVTEVFVDPSTGRVTGERDVGIHRGAVANTLRQLHVRLFLGAGGRAFVGLVGVLLVAVALLGLALSRRDVGAVVQGRRIIARQHTRLGWWSIAFHLLSGISGAVLGLEVVPTIVRRVLHPAHPRPVVAPAALPAGSLARAVLAAQRAVPGATVRVLRFDEHLTKVTVCLDHPSPWIAHSATQVRVSLVDSAVLNVNDAREAPLASRAYDLLDPVHFGYFGEAWGTFSGYTLRALWCVAGLSPAALFLTGFTLWRKRARRRDHAGAALRPRGAEGGRRRPRGAARGDDPRGRRERGGRP